MPACLPIPRPASRPLGPAADLAAAAEHSGAPPRVWVGACAVDCATGQLLLGQWLDDELRSQVSGAGGVGRARGGR